MTNSQQDKRSDVDLGCFFFFLKKTKLRIAKNDLLGLLF